MVRPGPCCRRCYVNLTSKGIGTLWDFRQGKEVMKFITSERPV